MNRLEIKDFSKIYKGGKKAVDNFSLTVSEGDLYGFIGHNGAGKSTTLKAIAGILDFEEGEILVEGYSVQKNPLECKRRIAYIPDNPDVYEHLTGIQYLQFIADIYGVEEGNRRACIQKYGELFEMSLALGDLISSYSHGMKQKVVLMGALLHRPKLLLLDEPFVGLDPKAAFVLKEAMKELCEEGSAIFFSTHVLEVAQKLCNKIVMIKQGKLIAAGETQQLLQDQSLEALFLEVLENEK
jgi:ABC-2 type transport system ATP-binding protein